MNKESTQVAEFHVAAGQHTALVPTMPDLPTRILRAKLILEEAIETIIRGLQVGARFRLSGTEYADRLQNESSLEGKLSLTPDQILDMLSNHAEWFELGPGNLIEIADGCADLRYVTVGTELACGIDGEVTMDEVHRSNMSKFIDGHRAPSGKWIKGPSYSSANIAGVLRTQPPLPLPSPEIKTNPGATSKQEEA